jgi:hypothetical protein
MMKTGIVADFLAWILKDRIQSEKDSSRKAGYEEGYRKGRIDGETIGRETGQEEGFAQGDSAGYARGYEEGKWVIEDRRAPATMQPLDQSIYGPKRFEITGEIEAAMRSEVAVAVNKGVISNPLPSQWQMILSTHPATCIAAGAGSGKTTTLILRVVLMLVHLRIPREEMTVISFTRASAREIREKLIRALAAWDYELEENEASKLVRTFHSVLYQMARVTFPGRAIG